MGRSPSGSLLTIESLDLPHSINLALISLRNIIWGTVQEIEERLRLISDDFGKMDSDPIFSSDEDEDEAAPLSASRPLLGHRNPSSSSLQQGLPPNSFIQQVSEYVNQLKEELFKAEDTLIQVDPLGVDDTPDLATISCLVYPSLPELRLRERLGLVTGNITVPDSNQLIRMLIAHSEKIQDVLSQLCLFSQSPYQFAKLPAMPALATDSISLLRSHSDGHVPNPPEPCPSPSVLRQYFVSESERLASVLPAFPASFADSLAQSSNQITSALRAYKQEAQAALHEGEVFIREEGEKLKGWVDSETESLRLALQAGASRLLTYHELPEEWKNNRFIISGYRFIPLERWHHLLLSGVQWHNETINIHTHFFGTLSLIYLLCFLWPTTAHTDPETSTFGDRAISLIFIVCAIKCLVCSTAWHLFAGCGTLGPFRRLACVDYVGISGLIAASVVSTEYYGFYCRPGLASMYMAFTTTMGVIGMILPFQPFFDRPESKGIRIVFFVSMACSALIPQAHMAYLYGIRQTFNFYQPAVPSVISYLSGLFFYASNWPERIRPGWVFDTLFHSHQFWHVAIVVAIWLHWRAIGFLHDSGRVGFSCAVDAQELASGTESLVFSSLFNFLRSPSAVAHSS